jgi:hypothetical protein
MYDVQQARDEVYLRNNLVTGLPALGERVQQIRVGKAATTAAENDKQLERSQVRQHQTEAPASMAGGKHKQEVVARRAWLGGGLLHTAACAL